jgi:hypothetical protein
MHPAAPLAAPGTGKILLPSGAEIRRFLLPPGNKDCGTVASESLKSGFRLAGYDDLDERENRNLKLIHQMHWSWCRRTITAESPCLVRQSLPGAVKALRRELEEVGVELIEYPSEQSTHNPGGNIAVLVANVTGIHTLMGAVARLIAADCPPSHRRL